LPVRVNNSESLRFLLDTGAGVPFALIDKGRAQVLNLEFQEKRQVGATGGSTALWHIKGAAFSLPGLEFYSQTLGAIDIAPQSVYEGRVVDGILGYDFIRRFVVEIDYAARTLSLYDPVDYKYSGRGEMIPIKLEGKTPQVHARITQFNDIPIETDLAIDTGRDDALVLNNPFVETYHLLQPQRKMLLEPAEESLGGTVRNRISRLKRLQLGRFALRNLTTVFSQDTEGPMSSKNIGGFIGSEILRRFKITFDYSRQRMTLEPNAYFGQPFEYDMTGIRLIAEGPDFRSFKVHRIIAASPAFKAGLQEGDLIVAINDQPTAKLTLEEVQQMFRLDGRSYRLSIKRGNKVFQTKIKLMRLI
jgi:hypothetical protein